ncbi:hypothetical protein [Sphingosinicella sp. CPCC 101087]|uniref:hypothetical protein n=1 Tax=Sphingosinicella sp. CPCC 101087 TaxID=2497754 RepID=UPI00101D726D|nr:hypothetical protein [Sphingosinicella sp. CPCC 101087]
MLRHNLTSLADVRSLAVVATSDLSARLVRRLRRYWKVEAANVALLPAAALWIASTRNEALGPAFVIAAVPMGLLLGVGAAYWRRKAVQLEGKPISARTIMLLARAEPMLLMAVLAGLAAALAVWLVPGLAVSRWDRWATTLTAGLAAAEYVNYFRVQLQHFDRMADLRRLLRGRGFRRAHLRREIDALPPGWRTADR